MSDMLDQTNENDEPPSMVTAQDVQKSGQTKADTSNGKGKGGLFSWIKSFSKSKNGSEHLREAIEEYIEELNDNGESPSIAQHEQALITNVLKLRDLTVVDVMIPRADIVAIDKDTSQEDLMALLADKQYSRLPVYQDSMDNIIGTIHIKDILSHLAVSKDFKIKDLMRKVPIVSPSMPLLDLMLEMRQSKKHMALVVDEYGGIDGLVTIGDVLESIVGEIDDEFDLYEQPEIIEKPDGTVLADGRVDIGEFEERYGELLSEEERNDIDTLGGLVFSVAGRIPARGEVLKHESGLVFEILDADPRRINRLRIKNIPQNAAEV